jgi:hypothetical protein
VGCSIFTKWVGLGLDLGNLFIFITKKVRKMAKKSPKSLLPTKDVHCLVKQEKKFVPYKISPPFFFHGLEWPNTHRRRSHKSCFRVQGGQTFLLGQLKNKSEKTDKTYLSKRYIIWICMEELKPYHKINQELFFKVCFIGPLKCFGYTCGPPKDFYFFVYLCFVNTFNRV